MNEIKQFYENLITPTENHKAKELKGDNNIFLFYDFETTTRMNVPLLSNHKMIPYLVCLELYIPSNINYGPWKSREKFCFEGDNCLNELFYLIK